MAKFQTRQDVQRKPDCGTGDVSFQSNPLIALTVARNHNNPKSTKTRTRVRRPKQQQTVKTLHELLLTTVNKKSSPWACISTRKSEEQIKTTAILTTDVQPSIDKHVIVTIQGPHLHREVVRTQAKMLGDFRCNRRRNKLKQTFFA